MFAMNAGVVHVYEQLQVAIDRALADLNFAAVFLFEEADGFLKRKGHSEIGKDIDQHEDAA